LVAGCSTTSEHKRWAIDVLVRTARRERGTQAAVLEARTGLAHIASGDCFATHMREPELGLARPVYVDRGNGPLTKL